jgi:RsmE family RNA methyltransferase
MNLILLEVADRDAVDPALYRVTGARARHIEAVLRAGVGRRVRVGLLDGPLGEAEIVALGPGEVLLRAAFEPETPPRPALDLILAVPRPKSLKKLLPELAALGVDRLFLLRTWRVERSYLESPLLRPEKMKPLFLEGLMQARATRLPEVHLAQRFRPFVEDRAPELFSGSLRLVAHPAARAPVASIGVGALGAETRVALAIGPEGGFIEPEIDSFHSAGFEAVSLGPRTLRVETAVVALLAQIELLRALPR